VGGAEDEQGRRLAKARLAEGVASRHSTSGAKSDPGDALVLAELARTDAHNHRPVAGDSDLAEAVKVLARARQSMIWTRQRQTNQLRSTLREFYPGALTCFDDLHGGGRPGGAGRGTRSHSAEACPARRSPRHCAGADASAGGGTHGGYPRRPRADQLAAPDVVSEAMGATVAALVGVIAELSAQIGRLEESLADRFEKHPAYRFGSSDAKSRSSPSTRAPRIMWAFSSITPAPAPGRSTTDVGRRRRPSPELYAHSPIVVSASSTVASAMASCTTRTAHGDTG